MMTAEMNKALRDDSGYQLNYDGNGDHWNIAWWQWRSLKYCMMRVEITGILYDDSGDHWNIVWWQWRSLKYCMTTVEKTEILHDTGDHWNIVWWQWRSLKCCDILQSKAPK
jgi:hypothetical protein